MTQVRSFRWSRALYLLLLVYGGGRQPMCRTRDPLSGVGAIALSTTWVTREAPGLGAGITPLASSTSMPTYRSTDRNRSDVAKQPHAAACWMLVTATSASTRFPRVQVLPALADTHSGMWFSTVNRKLGIETGPFPTDAAGACAGLPPSRSAGPAGIRVQAIRTEHVATKRAFDMAFFTLETYRHWWNATEGTSPVDRAY